MCNLTKVVEVLCSSLDYFGSCGVNETDGWKSSKTGENGKNVKNGKNKSLWIEMEKLSKND